MVKVGLIVRLEAKPGKEAAVSAMLERAVEVIKQEKTTTAWIAMRLGPTTFCIVDVFPDENGRAAHLNAHAEALVARAPEFFMHEPVFDRGDVVAAKLP